MWNEKSKKLCICRTTVSWLQISGGNRDNLGIFFLYLIKNIFCDPALEPSQQDGSIEESQHAFENMYCDPSESQNMLLCRNIEN